MSIFKKYSQDNHNCYGMTLWKSGFTLVEIWICPPNFSVGEHSHSQFDGNIMLLLGNVDLCKRIGDDVKSTCKRFHFHSIPAGTRHFFNAKSGAMIPTVFINVEKWHTASVTSACIDMQKV